MVFAEPGESCLNGETCISNYVCLNGLCLCPDGEISWDGNCVKEDIEIKKYITYQGKLLHFSTAHYFYLTMLSAFLRN